jgi:hypothetical protein
MTFEMSERGEEEEWNLCLKYPTCFKILKPTITRLRIGEYLSNIRFAFWVSGGEETEASALQEVFATSSGLKGLCSFMATEGIEVRKTGSI